MARDIYDATDTITVEGYTGRVKVADEGDVLRVLCMWFALCENDATTRRHHPVLGEVPICDRCDARIEAIERG